MAKGGHLHAIQLSNKDIFFLSIQHPTIIESSPTTDQRWSSALFSIDPNVPSPKLQRLKGSLVPCDNAQVQIAPLKASKKTPSAQLPALTHAYGAYQQHTLSLQRVLNTSISIQNINAIRLLEKINSAWFCISTFIK